MTTEPSLAELVEQTRQGIQRARDAALTFAHREWSIDRVFWKVGSTRGLKDGWWCLVTDEEGTVAMSSEVDDIPGSSEIAAVRAAHIAAWDPARVLEHCDAADGELTEADDESVSESASARSRASAATRIRRLHGLWA